MAAPFAADMSTARHNDARSSPSTPFPVGTAAAVGETRRFATAPLSAAASISPRSTTARPVPTNSYAAASNSRPPPLRSLTALQLRACTSAASSESGFPSTTSRTTCR